MKFPVDFKNSFNHSHSSILLWVHIDTYKQEMVKSKFNFQIPAMNRENIIIALLKKGWNSIDITELFDSVKFSNETIFDGLILECENDFKFELFDNYSKKLANLCR